MILLLSWTDHSLIALEFSIPASCHRWNLFNWSATDTQWISLGFRGCLEKFLRIWCPVWVFSNNLKSGKHYQSISNFQLEDIWWGVWDTTSEGVRWKCCIHPSPSFLLPAFMLSFSSLIIPSIHLITGSQKLLLGFCPGPWKLHRYGEGWTGSDSNMTEWLWIWRLS